MRAAIDGLQDIIRQSSEKFAVHRAIEAMKQINADVYGEAADEIERLGRIRAEIIEECARVADNYPTSKFSCVAKQNIAVAIRALTLSQADRK